MDVKDAVRKARHSFAELFGDDLINDIGLEEVRFDDSAKIWRITIGYYRDSDLGTFNRALGGPKDQSIRRYYRTVDIDDTTGELVSVSIREIAA